MKKIAVAIFALGAIVLVSGCAKKPAVQNEPQSNAGTGSGIINSIKDAIGMGTKMQCTYSYKDGNQTLTTTSYIEGKKYRGESEVMGKKQLSVFDGETFYTWSEADKKGTKWSKTCLDELNQNKQTSEASAPAPQEKSVKDASEAFQDATDVKCTPASSIDFSVPGDVTFSDMCQQLKDMQDKLNKNLPSNVNIPKDLNVNQNTPGNIPPDAQL